MKKDIWNFFFFLLLLISCNKSERSLYNHRFIHIMQGNQSAVTVSDKANVVGTYYIYLSTPKFDEDVQVEYEMVIGSGLKSGVDYELLNPGNSVTFLPGIYEMPIRIRWIANPIDPSKNNSIKINLISNNKGYTIGLPGPDQLQKSFIITKIK